MIFLLEDFIFYGEAVRTAYVRNYVHVHKYAIINIGISTMHIMILILNFFLI